VTNNILLKVLSVQYPTVLRSWSIIFAIISVRTGSIRFFENIFILRQNKIYYLDTSKPGHVRNI
jgi:hypothetical protein